MIRRVLVRPVLLEHLAPRRRVLIELGADYDHRDDDEGHGMETFLMRQVGDRAYAAYREDDHCDDEEDREHEEADEGLAQVVRPRALRRRGVAVLTRQDGG